MFLHHGDDACLSDFVVWHYNSPFFFFPTLCMMVYLCYFLYFGLSLL